MAAVNIKPKQLSKRLLGAVPERAQDVLVKRFGLLNTEPMTLEAIGEEYGITRERVRQIESFAINGIRKSELYKKEKGSFGELERYIRSLGGVVAEDELLELLAKKDSATQNHVVFLLVLGEPFIKHREDEHFKHRWVTDMEVNKRVSNALIELADALAEDELLTEQEITSRFLGLLKQIPEQYNAEEVAKRWIGISHKIGTNPLGDWGRTDSPSIRLRGTRDHAYLVIRRHGNPMHFNEVARGIERLFGRECHTATCHNELIKDNRFVLVGRGLYALREWGYETGVVRDVITNILKKHGPLSKDAIIEKVLKERYVKPNTIVVNLQNAKCFKKDGKGWYCVID